MGGSGDQQRECQILRPLLQRCFLCTTQEEIDEARKLKRCIAVARVNRIIFMGDAIALKDRAFAIDHMLKEADELYASRKKKKKSA